MDRETEATKAKIRLVQFLGNLWVYFLLAGKEKFVSQVFQGRDFMIPEAMRFGWEDHALARIPKEEREAAVHIIAALMSAGASPVSEAETAIMNIRDPFWRAILLAFHGAYTEAPKKKIETWRTALDIIEGELKECSLLYDQAVSWYSVVENGSSRLLKRGGSTSLVSKLYSMFSHMRDPEIRQWGFTLNEWISGVVNIPFEDLGVNLGE